MARETLDRLAVELSAVLSDLDAAIAAGFREARHQGGRRWREETRRHRTPIRGVIAAALRWFTRRQPERSGGA